jgi:hypothetical protein
VRAFEAQVREAIVKGVAWLERQQKPDGTWGPYMSEAHAFGQTALCLQTLATCGQPARDKHIVAGQRVLDRELEGRLRVVEWHGAHGSIITYSAAAVVLCYEALYGGVARAPGVAPQAGALPPCRLPKLARRDVTAIAEWLVGSRKPGGWRYPYENPEGRTDLSNTVYALLALRAAERCGVDPPLGLYASMARTLRELQAPTGPRVPRWLPNAGHVPWVASSDPFAQAGEDEARGWAYLPTRTDWTGSMTSAGVAALALVRDRLLEAKALAPSERQGIDAALLSGVAWLGANFDVRANPGAGKTTWHYYHLYGLERAGALTGLGNFGRHDWYREGAAVLLAQQAADGGWPAAARGEAWEAFQPAVVQTCFALLFLQRGTVPPSVPLGSTLTSR